MRGERGRHLALVSIAHLFLQVPGKLQRRVKWRRKACMSFHGTESGQSADLDRERPPGSLIRRRKPSRKGAGSREIRAPSSISTVVMGEFGFEIPTGMTHTRQRADFGLAGFQRQCLHQLPTG